MNIKMALKTGEPLTKRYGATQTRLYTKMRIFQISSKVKFYLIKSKPSIPLVLSYQGANIKTFFNSIF